MSRISQTTIYMSPSHSSPITWLVVQGAPLQQHPGQAPMTQQRRHLQQAPALAAHAAREGTQMEVLGAGGKYDLIILKQ